MAQCFFFFCFFKKRVQLVVMRSKAHLTTPREYWSDIGAKRTGEINTSTVQVRWTDHTHPEEIICMDGVKNKQLPTITRICLYSKVNVALIPSYRYGLCFSCHLQFISLRTRQGRPIDEKLSLSPSLSLSLSQKKPFCKNLSLPAEASEHYLTALKYTINIITFFKSSNWSFNILRFC